MDEIRKFESIKSRDEFVAFVNELSKSFRMNPESWENNDIGSYLDALAAWVSDMDGYYLNHKLPVPKRPDWKNVADMLLAARSYE